MTPQEKELVTQLFDRLKQAPAQPKDLDAESLIRDGIAAHPDAPYLLVQTALIQNIALDNAQARIADLERQLSEARQAAAKPTSFLGGLLGRDAPPPQPASPQPVPPPSAPPAPGAPWGPRPSAAAPGYGQPSPYGQPMMGAPAASGAGSFLRTAAAAAAGVAGGALLYQGISSMFGGHSTSPASAAGLTGGGPWGGTSSVASPDAAQAGLPDQSGLSQTSSLADDSDRDDSGQSDNQADDGGWDNSGDSSDFGSNDFDSDSDGGDGDFGSDA
jgi:hypothetical protein